MDTQHITQLVIEAQKGNSASMEALIESHYRDIYYFALKTVKNEDIAADITQESCLEITKTLGNLQNPSAFSVWVRRITYHQCTRYFKKTKDVIPDLNEEGESIFDSLPDETGDTEPDAVYEDKEFKMTMRSLVDSLPSEQSSALLLYYYEKMSVPQIAQIQGVPDGTVKSRLNYARKAFKQKVEDYEKRTGVRLHAATPISVLLAQLFKQGFSELLIPQMPLPGAATATVSAEAAGMGSMGGIGTTASAASGSIGAVGGTMANAVGVAAAMGSAAVGAAPGASAFAGGNTPANPHAKTEKTTSQTTAGAVAKSVASKAATIAKADGVQPEESKNESKSLIVPILCGLLITALLAAGAFVGIRYFMNRNKTSDVLDGGDHTHTTTRDWESHDDIHYKLCDICDASMYRSEHRFGDWIVDNTDHYRKCEVCGYTTKWIKHSADKWVTTQSDHKKICQTCKKEYESGKHTFDGWKYDQTHHYHLCDVCQYKADNSEHSFEWKYDKTEHYKVCLCGKVIEKASHTYTNDICICGHTYLPFELTYQLNNDNRSYSVCGIVELNETSVIVPATFNNLPVTGIEDGAFTDCAALTSISLPDVITTIGNNAFMGCTSLENVIFGTGPISIGDSAFENCTALTSITLPTDATTGTNTFKGCTLLKSVKLPEGFNSMMPGLFRGCTSLQSIVLPSSVSYISPYAFYGCTALTDVTTQSESLQINEYAFAECHSLVNLNMANTRVDSIGAHAFENCISLKSFITQAETVGYTNIAPYTFAGCRSLSEIKLPSYLGEIGAYAFKGCASLTSISLSDVQYNEMKEGAFYGCTSLESVILPDDLDYLPPYAFYGCTALTDVVFPRDTSVSPEFEDFGVGEYAFAECIRLENLDMEKNVTGFGAHAFENCISLKTFSIPTNYDNVGFVEVNPYVFAGCTALESIGQPYDFYIIYEGAFSGCVNLKTIGFGGSYAEIHQDAFKDCHSLSIQFTDTSDVWHTVYREDGWADPAMIVHCTDKSIDHLTHSYQFDRWSYDAEKHLRSCECGAVEEEWTAEPHNIVDHICTVCGMETGSEGLEYELNAEENGYILVYLGDCTDTEIYIPSMYNGLPVVGIGYSVFENCMHITSVHIPDSVRFIGSGAFLGTSITEIKIPEGVTVIEDNTFGMCQNLVSVTLPESVHTIHMFAFSYCSSLAEINLDNVRFIGSFAFQNCLALTELTLNDVLIEDNAFSGSGVVTVRLTGESELYAAVFANCASLKTVYLPASITYIDICTFQNCVSLEHIYFDGTIEDWNTMDRMDYEEDMDEMEMDLLWNLNTGEYTIHCTDGDLAK